MTAASQTPGGTPDTLPSRLQYLKLPYIEQHYASLAQQAAGAHQTHVDYLAQLIGGEAQLRQERSTRRRIRPARFPVIKTLDQFQWNWPKKLNRLQVRNLFRLQFIKDQANVIFLCGVEYVT